jgi:GDP/UDP-N,N'-diacetylbacillosamine 2-epimerase (hydrolysing)
MLKNKIAIITGTRADYGLLKSTIEGVIASPSLELCLIVTGMHTLKKYGSTIMEIKNDKFPISSIVKISGSDGMLASLAKEIIGIQKSLEKLKPDFMLVLGDRDEAFAGAITAGHLGMPLGHIHGGDVTDAIVDGPIRNAITKFAHLHFTACPASRKRVIGMSENPKNVFLVGAPGIDAAKKEKLLDRAELARALKIDSRKKWLLFLMHPAPFENIGLKEQISNPLSAIGKLSDFEKIIIYPNSDTGSDVFISEIEKLRGMKGYFLHKNLNRQIFLSLFRQIEFLIGNSSSGIMESPYFKLPAVNIGNRQKGRESGSNLISCGNSVADISKAIGKASSDSFRKSLKNMKNPYGSGDAGKKIVKIL